MLTGDRFKIVKLILIFAWRVIFGMYFDLKRRSIFVKAPLL